VPPTYQLDRYVINCGNAISASAHIRLTKGSETLEGITLGDGPIDAAFLSIEQVIGHHYELDDFQIQSVTEGREALGQTVVRLRSGGKLYSGRGSSTD
ncbi:MAG: alpha-isopropylmalate synthase regulatory domain-containing protein, partial [Eubacteriales bacterium]|nr:alpha-isopropylmalate synthase regulatory domain-containing protein [Eubacteriales bacterium]